jgi:hypothetical protein
VYIAKVAGLDNMASSTRAFVVAMRSVRRLEMEERSSLSIMHDKDAGAGGCSLSRNCDSVLSSQKGCNQERGGRYVALFFFEKSR